MGAAYGGLNQDWEAGMSGGRGRGRGRIGSRRLARVLAAGPIGALIAVGLSVIPATTVQAQVVRQTRAAEVPGPLPAGAEVRALPFPTRHAALYWAGNPEAVVTVAFTTDGTVHDAGQGRARRGRHAAGQRRDVRDHPARRRGDVGPGHQRPAAGPAHHPRPDRGGGHGREDRGAGNPAGAQAVDRASCPAPAGTPTRACASTGGARNCGRPVFQTVQKLVVHHTAGANGESGEAAKATIRSIYYYHSVTQGWGDIGYNFLIDAAGVVYKGRHSHAPGSSADTLTGENAAGQGVTAGHAFGYNSGTVGVAMLGTYSSVDAPTPTKDALRSFLISKAKAHGLDTAKRASTPARSTAPRPPSRPARPPGGARQRHRLPGGYFQDSVLRCMRSEIQAAAGPADITPPVDPAALNAALEQAQRGAELAGIGRRLGTGGGGTSGVAGYDIWRAPAGGTPARIASTTALTWTDTTPGHRRTTTTT